MEFGRIEQILCLGAHCDDIEIGCAGTLLKLAQHCPDAHIRWVVLSSNNVRADEAREAASEIAGNFANLDIDVLQFRNGYFPQVSGDIKDYFEQLKKMRSPDLIFTHHRKDLHQDHRITCELTWNTFRDHLILEYEIPKWEPDFGNPNVLIALSEEQAKAKAALIENSFPSQSDKQWFSQDVFLSLMRLRGIQAATAFAEGFHVSKLVVG